LRRFFPQKRGGEEEDKGDKTVFTVDDDGVLNGPPGGFLTRLTKKK
jgi:hypothetical protein